MDVSSVTGGTGAKAASALGSIGETFDNFLLLLTKQLQHQDPLSPLDTNEFTQQLVQFTGVEQQIGMNQRLDDLIALQVGNHAIGALDFLNTSVEAASNDIWLGDGDSTITYNLAGTASLAQMTIRDADGKIVRTLDIDRNAGAHSVAWDGTDNDGADLPDGVYRVEVKAVDRDGASIKAVTGFRGTVSGVELDGGDIWLSIGDLRVPIGKVQKITNAPAA